MHGEQTCHRAYARKAVVITSQSVYQERSLDEGTRQRIQTASQRYDLGQLTQREREVAFLVADGLKNRAIAQRLAISPATVATYVQRIQARLDLRQRSEIEVWMRAHGATAHPDVLPPPVSGGAGLRQGYACVNADGKAPPRTHPVARAQVSTRETR